MPPSFVVRPALDAMADATAAADAASTFLAIFSCLVLCVFAPGVVLWVSRTVRELRS